MRALHENLRIIPREFPQFFQLAMGTLMAPTVQRRSGEKRGKLPGIFEQNCIFDGPSRQRFAHPLTHTQLLSQ